MTEQKQKLLYQMDKEEYDRVDKNEFVKNQHKQKVKMKLNEIYEVVTVKVGLKYSLNLHYRTKTHLPFSLR